MGVLIGSAVAPIALCLAWKKTNKWGAMCGALFGQWLGLMSWLVFAKVRCQSSPVLLRSTVKHIPLEGILMCPSAACPPGVLVLMLCNMSAQAAGMAPLSVLWCQCFWHLLQLLLVCFATLESNMV